MSKRYAYTAAAALWAIVLGAAGGFPPSSHAWDHPGHMTTAAIAFAEIERANPELIPKIGLLLLKHPDPAPFWVSTVGARGDERTRRMFIEAARWPDDAKFTGHDRPTWHTARYAIIADDAPPEAKALVESRGGRPIGNAIEALVLNAGMLINAESKHEERALALSWMMHGLGDIHQPMHVSDLFSKQFPTGNASATLAYVWDPLQDSAMPLHILWDSHTRRSTKLMDVDGYAKEIMAQFPRSSLPELKAYEGPGDFEKWARESHQVAIDWAYDVEVVSDSDQSTDADRLVANMAKYILEGISPLDEAPVVPAEYWEKVQETASRHIALAGYRIADIILATADSLVVERTLAGKVLDALPRHGPTN